MADNDVLGAHTGDEYRHILETAPDAMLVVDDRGVISLVNVQTERLFGYPRHELLGRSLDILIPERFRSGHGAHLSRFFRQPTTRPMGSGLELFGRRKDSTEVPIEISLSPVPTSTGTLVSAAIRDISERKRMEAAARLNADRLASAVESIQDSLALYDAKNRLVLCNSAYRRLIGDAASGTLIGRSYEELLDASLPGIDFASDGERARFRRDRLDELGADKGTSDFRTHDGRSFRVTSRRTVEGGIVQTIWDLTDDVSREQELREARTAAEAGSAAKSDFLSSMSHELRTPLNAILGFAQLLQRDKKEPITQRHKERVDQILRGGEHLLRLIDDILDLSRIEAGVVSISTEPVSVIDVLDEVKTTLGPAAARAGTRIEVDSPPPDLPMVAADRTRFAQILMNYGSNAVKYNRPGGRVTFSVSTLAEHVRITVADTGLGIPQDKQDKLFQPFQRAGQETGPIEGTGIGLVITKRLAELMGGSVGFRSSAGKGSEFWVDMRVHILRARPSTPPAASTGAETHWSGEARTSVLYVEDNPANVAFMRDLLGSFEGIDLVAAPTAEMGLELARERLPNLIVMDINLPGMSGVDALRVLQSEAATANIPVIALTAAASERDKQRGLQAGFYRYLTKPVKVDELITAIESLLEVKP
jgi:PAS domain S-box-containing protein